MLLVPPHWPYLVRSALRVRPKCCNYAGFGHILWNNNKKCCVKCYSTLPLKSHTQREWTLCWGVGVHDPLAEIVISVTSFFILYSTCVVCLFWSAEVVNILFSHMWEYMNQCDVAYEIDFSVFKTIYRTSHVRSAMPQRDNMCFWNKLICIMPPVRSFSPILSHAASSKLETFPLSC